MGILSKKIKLYLSVALLFTMPVSEAFSRDCSSIFTQEANEKSETSESLIENLVQIETRLNAIESMPITKNIREFISRARSSIDSLIDKNPAQIEVKREIDNLNASLEKIERTLSIQQLRRENNDFNQLLLNPSIVRPEYLYEIQGMDMAVKRVLFSKEVTEEIFWSENPLYQRASLLILKGIFRGRAFATDNLGIISFNTDRNVYKVKITGNTVGAIRVVGYLRGADFYVVDFSFDSNHKSSNSNALVESVYRLKKQRGH